MRRSTEFSSVVRSGSRVRSGSVVVHHHRDLGSGPARVGLVVSKAVGSSVVRHQVSRRLRAQLAHRLVRLPDGSLTVVRALPESATASSQDLGRALDRAFDRLAG